MNTKCKMANTKEMALNNRQGAKTRTDPSTLASPSPSPSSSISCTSSTAVLSSTSSPFRTQQRKSIKLSKLYHFVAETYRDIRKHISGFHNDMNNTFLIETINKYRRGCYEMYNEVLESLEMSRMLSENIARTLDLLKDISTLCINLDEYYHRVCELISIFISCELRVCVDNDENELITANRIVYIMRKYLTHEEEEATRFNILRTLVYVPRFFNARDIMCAIFEEFLPLKATTEVISLPDKLYMLYIIVFYRWMKMQRKEDDQQLIVNFAEGFMKPKVSLCTNKLYCQHLPRYEMHSKATRTILKHMQFYRDLRNACIIDNAYKVYGTIVNLCDDDDDVVVLDESGDNLSFSELFAAVQLESDKSFGSNMKREDNVIVDSVDLTVDDEDDDAAIRSIRDRHEKWLHNLSLLAIQYRETQKRLQQQQQQQNAQSKTGVICVDSDSSEADEQQSQSEKSKETSNSTNTSNIAETEDLFADNYPITVTPIDCNANLENSDNEDDDDGTKLAPRFVPTSTLRTYVVKKSSSCSVSSAEDSEYRVPNKSATINNNCTLLGTRKINCRRNSLHIYSAPAFQQVDDESTDADDYNCNNVFHTASQRRIKSKGPGVPYANINSTFGGGDKVIFSQALPSRNYYPQSDSQEEATLSKKSEQKSKRVHFDSSPMGPTAAYSKRRFANKSPNTSQQNYKNMKASDNFQPVAAGEFDPFQCASSTSAYATMNTSPKTKRQQNQEEHIAAAATLFRNVFDRSRTNCLQPTFSSMLSPKPSLFPPRIEQEEEQKRSVLKRNRLAQRRSTICGRSDFNDYAGQGSSIAPAKIKVIPRRRLTQHDCGPGQNWDWEGVSMTGTISDHLDVASEPGCHRDEKLKKRCTVVIKPTEELLQYERQRDAMYNEILQKQRKKLELRTIEKMKEKERRRQEKQQKRDKFLREQSETVKQLERMQLSDEEDVARQTSCNQPENVLQDLQDRQPVDSASSFLSPSIPQNHSKIETQVLTCRYSPQKRRLDTDLQQGSEEFPPPKRASIETCSENLRLQPEQFSQLNSQEAEQRQELKSTEKVSPQAGSSTLKVKAQTKKVTTKKNATTTKKMPKNATINSKTNRIPSQNQTSARESEMDSSETEQMPLLQRKTRLKKSSQQITKESQPGPCPTQKRKPDTLKERVKSPTKQPPARSRRQSVYVSSPAKNTEVVQTTDSEMETRQTARISRDRRKSVSTRSSSILKDTELTTDSEMESERRPPSVLRQSPRFARGQINQKLEQSPRSQKINLQSKSEVDSQGMFTQPRPVDGRSKLNNPKFMKHTPVEHDTQVNETVKENTLDETITEHNLSLSCSVQDNQLTEQNIVAVIAERLSSPHATIMPNQIESSDHEDILENLEDIIGKETTLQNDPLEDGTSDPSKSYVTSAPNAKISSGDTQNSKRNLFDTEPLADVVDMQSVIENIVLDEIQREMDAESNNISKIHPTECGNVPETETVLASYDKHQVVADCVAPHSDAEPTQTKGIIINFEEDGLQDMLTENSVPMPAGNCDGSPATQDTLPLLISHVESLNHLQTPDNDQSSFNHTTTSAYTKDDGSSDQALVTENILLANGFDPEVFGNAQIDKNSNREVHNTEDENLMMPPLLSKIQPSTIIQSKVSDISLPALTQAVPTPVQSSALHLPDMPLLGTIQDADMTSSRTETPTLAKGDEQNVSIFLNLNEKMFPEVDNETEKDHHGSTKSSHEQNNNNNLTVTEAFSDVEYQQSPRTEQSSTLNVVRTKASLKLPCIKPFRVKIERMDVSRYLEKQQLKQDDEKRSSTVSSPTESIEQNVGQEDSVSRLTPFDDSSNAANSNDNVSGENELMDDKATQEEEHRLCENDFSKAVETFGTSPTPTTSQAKNTKTVTFNLVAEIIPNNTVAGYSSDSSTDDGTSPPGYNWVDETEDVEETEDQRIHRYYSPSLTMITPATRKYFNDDSMIVNRRSSSCSSEDEEERQELFKNTQFNARSESVSSYMNDDDHIIPEYIAEEVIVETSNHHFFGQINKTFDNGASPHMGSEGYMAIETTESVPIYLFSDDIVDMVPSDSILVSSTYVPNKKCHTVKATNKSLMSPSEQEVSSTQETLFQSPKKGSANEDKSSPTTQTSSSPEDNISSNALQNNQVDTTNHLPDIYPSTVVENSSTSTQTSRKKGKARRMSSGDSKSNRKSDSKTKSKCTETTSSAKSSKKSSTNLDRSIKNSESNGNQPEKETTKEAVANVTTEEYSARAEEIDRNSPSTTTSHDVIPIVPDQSKAIKYKAPKLKCSQGANNSTLESETTKCVNPVSRPRNPFVTRKIKPKPESPNAAIDDKPKIEQKSVASEADAIETKTTNVETLKNEVMRKTKAQRSPLITKMKKSENVDSSKQTTVDPDRSSPQGDAKAKKTSRAVTKAKLKEVVEKSASPSTNEDVGVSESISPSEQNTRAAEDIKPRKGSKPEGKKSKVAKAKPEESLANEKKGTNKSISENAVTEKIQKVTRMTDCSAANEDITPPTKSNKTKGKKTKSDKSFGKKTFSQKSDKAVVKTDCSLAHEDVASSTTSKAQSVEQKEQKTVAIKTLENVDEGHVQPNTEEALINLDCPLVIEATSKAQQVEQTEQIAATLESSNQFAGEDCTKKKQENVEVNPEEYVAPSTRSKAQNVEGKDQKAAAATKPLAEKANIKLDCSLAKEATSTKSKAQNVEGKDQTAAAAAQSAKGDSSLVKEDLAPITRSKAESVVEKQTKAITTKSSTNEAVESAGPTSTNTEELMQTTQEATSECSLANKDLEVEGSETENNEQPAEKVLASKPQTSLESEEAIKTGQKVSRESSMTKDDTTAIAGVASPNSKPLATKRVSTPDIEHRAKKGRRFLNFTDLQETINQEINTMAAELSIPKVISELDSKKSTQTKDKRAPINDPSQRSKYKENLKDSKAKSTNQQDQVEAVKVNDLRTPTTTGIKSAVSHVGRRHSAKNRSDSSTSKSAHSTHKSTVAGAERNSKAKPSDTSSMVADSSNDNATETTSTAANTPKKRGNATSSSDSVSSENADKNKTEKPLPTTVGSCTTTVPTTNSVATTNAANHVRKKQRIK